MSSSTLFTILSSDVSLERELRGDVRVDTITVPLEHDMTLGEVQDLVRIRARGNYVLMLEPGAIPVSDIVDVLVDAISEDPTLDAVYGDYWDVSAQRVSQRHVRQLASAQRKKYETVATLDDDTYVPLPAWSPYRLRTDDYIGRNLCIRADYFASVQLSTEERAAPNLWPLLRHLAASDATVVRNPYGWFVRTRKPTDDDTYPAAPSAADAGMTSAIAPQTVSLITVTAGFSKPVRGVENQFFLQHMASIGDLTRTGVIEHLIVIGPECEASLRRDLLAGKFPVTVVDVDQPFNFAHRMNEACKQAKGELLVFLNDDVEFRDPQWCEVLLTPFENPRVGIVGTTLLYEDDTIQHAGVEVSVGTYNHLGHRLALSDPANSRWFAIDREVDAVTGACFVVRADLFQQVGGFFEGFPLNFNDVDLCMKIRWLGYSIILSARPIAYHYESLSRPAVLLAEELVLMHSRWPESFDRSAYPFS